MKKKHIDYTNWSNDELVKELKRIKEITYGLVWHRDVPEEKIDVLINPDARTPEEMFANEVAGKPFPVLKEVNDKEFISNKDDQTHILIEGDNYHALAVLNFTHQEAIDVIYIDPPYNTGKNDFVYTDKFKSDYVLKEDPFRHSKWLSFMEKRLNLAHKLLAQNGVMIIHIDENEENALYFLLSEIFGEENDLGKIVWNKQNPKGDSRGVSIMHESILCFAKNKEEFLKLDNVMQRKKPNAEKMLRKAKILFKKIDKTMIPDEIKEVIKPFNYKKEILDNFKITYDLDLVNKEFQNWIKHQSFSGGEKAYKYIDEQGRVYRGVSMAWPNKKKAPSDYFIPLVHPITKKECPIPQRGWRYSIKTMKEYLSSSEIIFGEDESKQPERKYYLEDNLLQNTPSIFSDASSDDDLLSNMNVKFDYPKPHVVSKYLLDSIHPSPKIILDFMAGSGTTGHAILELNKEDNGNRKFILCTNNENKIATDTCQPRLEKVIKGYENSKNEKIEGLGGNLKYYTAYDFVESEPSDKNKHKLVSKCTEMLCIKEGIYDLATDSDEYKIFKSHDNRYLGIIFYEDAIDEYKKAIEKIDGSINTYVFSLGDDPHTAQFSDVADKVVLQAIPEIILKVYQEIFR